MDAIYKLILIFSTLIARIMHGQTIDIYYPVGTLNPSEVDEFGGEYEHESITITGVVSGENQSAHCGSKGYKTHMFSLQRWKVNGTFQSEKLLVFRPIEDSRDFFDEIPKYSIVKLQLFVNKEKNRSVLVSGEIMQNPEIDLIEIKKTLIKPVFLKIQGFDDFQLNKDINVFEGNTRWNNEPIELVIQVEEGSEITDEVETLNALMANQAEWKRKVDNYAVKELLQLKNESWLEDGEREWDKDTFIKTYKLKSICILKDGNFQFWHDDGDIFGGHSILIEGTIKEGPTYADIPG